MGAKKRVKEREGEAFHSQLVLHDKRLMRTNKPICRTKVRIKIEKRNVTSWALLGEEKASLEI